MNQNSSPYTQTTSADNNPESLPVTNGHIPQHVAVIMDGNGRWAKKNSLLRVAGHRKGTEATKRTVKACKQLGIRYLTIYVFSSENWQRPSFEVNALMGLLVEKLHQEIDELHKENVRLRAVGRLDKLPPKTLKELQWGMEKTKDNNGLDLILAISYGGREEIVDACKKIVQNISAGNIKETDVTEETFKNYLYLPDVPDPDLLIRTGGDLRVSNFLLWQIAYSEIYVTPTLWPDFQKSDLEEAVIAFQQRQRRFGKVLDGES